MKQKLKKLDGILSWVLLIAVSIALIFSIFNMIQAKKTGEAAFLLGYRPVFVLTGSMEPYMMTNSICLTKKVDSMEDIEVGDVVTFHADTSDGRTVNITHRIISIDANENITTKGDNNRVDDALPLTIDNVDAKVVGVFNQTAWLIAKWQTTTGKVLIICAAMSLILIYFLLKSLLSLCTAGKDEGESDNNISVREDASADEPEEFGSVQFLEDLSEKKE